MLHNLLSARQRQTLHTDYRLRLATVCLFVLAIAMLLGTTSLVPVYVYLHSELEIVQQEEAQYRATDGSEAAAARDELAAAAELVTELGGVLAAERPTAVLDAVLNGRPEGISLTGYMYDSTASQVTLEGIAANRDALVTFVHDLEQHERFGVVPTPIGNLAKNVDLPFSLTFSVLAVDTIQ